MIYGLIGILAIAPWINEHLLSNARKQSVIYVVQLNGANLTTGTLILTVMILPIMVAITRERAGGRAGLLAEGSAALGVNRWRTIRRVSLRTAWPAIAAGAVLATARALGEAVMLAMVAGGQRLLGQPAGRPDVPVRARPAARGDDLPGIGGPDDRRARRTRSMRWLPSCSSRPSMLSLAGWAVKQPLKRYGIRA